MATGNIAQAAVHVVQGISITIYRRLLRLYILRPKSTARGKRSNSMYKKPAQTPGTHQSRRPGFVEKSVLIQLPFAGVPHEEVLQVEAHFICQ